MTSDLLGGRTIWITGLSGAGKSTLAEETARRLRWQGDRVVVLDGDELREVFCAAAQGEGSYSREGRLSLAMQYSRLCNVIARQGLTVVIATISLFREVHAFNREHLPGYFEVYMKTPLEELLRRDPKGIYRRYEAGIAANLAGLDLQVDEPEKPDLVIEYAPGRSPPMIAEELIAALNERVRA